MNDLLQFIELLAEYRQLQATKEDESEEYPSAKQKMVWELERKLLSAFRRAVKQTIVD